MPILETTNFGDISYTPQSVFEFPNGLPGFDHNRRFIPVQNPRTAPILFLQSIEDGSLCFTTIPVRVLDPDYRLLLSEADLEALGYSPEAQPQIGTDVLCVAVLSIRESGATANLLAPIVVNLDNHKAVQAIAADSDYSHQHRLFPQEAPVCS